MLYQTTSNGEKLQLEEVDLVCDYAIYCKALEVLILPDNELLRQFINLRMGGFHEECTFFAVIEETYKDANTVAEPLRSNLQT